MPRFGSVSICRCIRCGQISSHAAEVGLCHACARVRRSFGAIGCEEFFAPLRYLRYYALSGESVERCDDPACWQVSA